MTLREWIKACRTCIVCNACIGVLSGFALAFYVLRVENAVVDSILDGERVIGLRALPMFCWLNSIVGILLAAFTSHLLQWNDRGPYWAMIGVGLVCMTMVFVPCCGLEAWSALMTVRAVALGGALLVSCLMVALARYVEA